MKEHKPELQAISCKKHNEIGGHAHAHFEASRRINCYCKQISYNYRTQHVLLKLLNLKEQKPTRQSVLLY